MRPRVLVLVPLLGAFLGALVSALVIRPQPPCVGARHQRGRCPRGWRLSARPCNVPHGLPVELWVGIASGLLLVCSWPWCSSGAGTGSCDPLAKGGQSQPAVLVGKPGPRRCVEQRVVLARVGDGPGPAPRPLLPGATSFPYDPSVCKPGDGRSTGTLLLGWLGADRSYRRLEGGGEFGGGRKSAALLRRQGVVGVVRDGRSSGRASQGIRDQGVVAALAQQDPDRGASRSRRRSRSSTTGT